MSGKRLLLVANVAKEHVLKFHIPTIRSLTERGWTVDVACAGDDTVPYCDKQFKMLYKRSPFNFALIKGIFQLRRIVREGRYDVVYCHTPVGGMAARFAAVKERKRGTKVIYFAHGYHFYKGAPKINWLLYYTLERFMSSFTDATILINREDYELTAKKFKKTEPYLLNGIGVDTSRLDVENPAAIREEYRRAMNIPSSATVLIYLAELLANKNQTFLLRVVKRLLDERDDIYLVLAGFDHSDGEFQRYAQELGIADHVRFLGWREDAGALYSMADICTATSIREGFGLNLVEAMYCGLPVVATKNRGHETIIRDGENGFLVSLDDEELFAERILQLVTGVECKDRFIAAGRAEADKYGSPAVLCELQKILNKYSD